jgi:hypothetical protein
LGTPAHEVRVIAIDDRRVIEVVIDPLSEDGFDNPEIDDPSYVVKMLGFACHLNYVSMTMKRRAL